MAPAISALDNIEIKKSLFGLKTQVIYTPTHSTVNCYQYDYAPEAEASLKKLLEAVNDKVADEVKGVAKHRRVDMGNVRLEAAVSTDHQFAALQLTKFVNFNYTPVSGVKIFEGVNAQSVAALFS